MVFGTSSWGRMIRAGRASMTYHATEEELDRFLARRLDSSAQARLVRHLLSGCDFCRRSVAVRQAYGAIQVAASLHPDEYAPAAACDLQALAWGELANALRIGELYDESRAAFRRAHAMMRQGSGEPRLFARLSWLEGSLCIDQRRAGPCERADFRLPCAVSKAGRAVSCR